MSRNPGRPRHWSVLVAESFRPSHATLVEQHVQRIEDAANVELAELIREAQAKAAGVPYVPVTVEQQVAAERERLAAMSVDEILAEEAQEAAELAALLAEAKATAEATHAAILAGDCWCPAP